VRRRFLALEQLEGRSVPSASAQQLPGPTLDAAAERLAEGQQALQQINHFVVIYQENWSFDALYGNFPGANGIANASQTALTQIDRQNGNALSTEATYNPAFKYAGGADPTLQNPPPPLKNTSTGAIDTRFLTNPSNPGSPTAVDTLLPYNVSAFVQPSQTTGDIVHKFYEEQSQINHGAQNQYVTWSDNPGLVMSHFDATNLPEGLIAQQYTMDDNFFHAAFGGSFLNHQFLVAAAAPVYPNAATLNPGALPTLDASGQLALDSHGKIIHDGSITPVGSPSFGDPGQTFNQNYVVNTTFSVNLSPDFIGNVTSASLLPSQNDSNPNDPTRPYTPTIGDTLDQAGLSWKWYSGGWDNALAASPSNPANNGKTANPDPADPNFQWHHQPLAYYDHFAPWMTDPNNPTGPRIRNPLSAAHLQDETNFFDDLSGGNLPAVSFIKPIGEDNEHPGYTSLLLGQQHVADIVHAIQNSSDWADTAIIITYDENGGRWDHVSAPDANGIWGDGTRVPTIVVSPYSRQGTVDHLQHDTLSILKTLEQRFNLPALNSLDAQASSLADNFQATPHVSIGKAYLQPDANSVGKNVLVVLGTEGNDHIQIGPASDPSQIEVRIDSVHLDQTFPLAQISRIQVYGQGGNDHIEIDPRVTLPAMIFGGAGNDHIQTGSGNTVVVGGTGNNHIEGGSGRNLLIGGTGNSHIEEHGGQAIEIAGTTFYDANAEALTAIANEWASSDPLATRVARITSGVTQDGSNTQYHLAMDTVFANGYHNHLEANSGMDWYFADPATDHVDSFIGQDVFTAIKPRP
jgi:phospholipase C